MLIAALLVAATAVVYRPVAEHEFVDYDDIQVVAANENLRVDSPAEALRVAFTTTLNANWIPLTTLSLQLDRALFGEGPAPVLLTNAALHAAGSVALFAAFVRLSGALWPSAFVAGVFALHPLHVESVAWASMRKDVLSALFFALTLLAWAGYTRAPGPGRYLLVLLGLVAGLLAKPVVVTLPFVLLLLDFWPLRRVENAAQRRRALLEKLPLLVPVAIACAVTIAVQQAAGAMSQAVRPGPALRAANALDAYGAYLLDSVWPSGLAVFYPHPLRELPLQRALLAGLLLASVTAGALVAARSRRYLAVGWLWFLGTMVPMIGLVQVGMQARADRYMHLPSIGLSIALAWGATDLLARRRAGRLALAGAGGAALVALGAASAAQLEHWRDAIALHRRAVSVTEGNFMEHHRLAAALLRAGRVEPSIEAFRRSIELQPGRPGPHFGLGNALASLGRLEEAEPAYREGLRLEPEHARGHAQLAYLLIRAGRGEEARPHLERALALHESRPLAEADAPEVAAPYAALAELLAEQGDLEGAIARYRQALAIDPRRIGAHAQLGLALARSGRHAEAIPHLSRALAVKRDSAWLQAGIAMSFAGVGRPRDAIRHYRNALVLRPGWRHAVNDLAWILATSPDPSLRDPEEAIRLIEAVRLETETLPGLLDTLAAGYAAAGRFDAAVRTAERARELALRQHMGDLAAEIDARSALYRQGRAYVAPAEGEPPFPRSEAQPSGVRAPASKRRRRAQRGAAERSAGPRKQAP
jgi:tetratricopeptide (TPR) repeat protein